MTGHNTRNRAILKNASIHSDRKRNLETKKILCLIGKNDLASFGDTTWTGGSAMSKGARALFCFAAISWAGMAEASTLPPLVGPYAGNYNVESINTGSNLHTFWLPNLISGQSNYWQFDANGGSFNHSGANATLNGTIVNNSDAMKQFDVDITFNFSHKGNPGPGPKCEFGGAACASAKYVSQSAQFEYFTYATATLTGLNMLSGLTLALTVAPVDGSLPPQLGYGANNKDIDEFGFSSWFKWNVASNTTGTKYGNGQGDINIELTPVPVPAALPLLGSVIAGFGFFGWLRRRRSEASA